ncbi:cysteine-rich CWC family protein [Paenibacillus beijingensis]|uniref:Cysteine-rich CWC n=1 Tax=Paenibacillus beijingensis TaxID=1126833 RepID=A0A0D5NGL5_9BACL|nr:cysteine-rich CWC family protein [Paenibacillus beijingensis]AJY74406.1 hypothetical protein VN24_07230 [Paenibacillus beijingensis]
MAANGTAADDAAMRCPLCGGGNACSVAQGGDGTNCWCVKANFPKEFFAQIPDDQRGRACFCAGCLQRFKERRGLEKP